ncbi:TusE/DsrC/DsvC family sulfur relay protein [Desulfospira joergensenii]|uniref:TusE/DsrC/DsvC family sulfur relay protein n=1 Tax=Desulfospira joergensenii TaxID=53329 RepID=UPI0003B78DD8|nr:TusE/DsrC/DsvC family sulfur relay protein [Desulfospira joergensenii]
MTSVNREEQGLALDPEGYLIDFNDWTEQVACDMADREGVSRECPLDKERMDILKFMREYYTKFEAFPILRAICKNVGQERTCNYHQFPDPIVAWKIAGLPKPTPEVFAKIKTVA